MIKYSNGTTDDRIRNIQEQLKNMAYNRSKTLAAFGIKVDDQNFLKVPARQILPPKIVYNNGTVTPSKGQWRMDFGKSTMQFLDPAKCSKWSILNSDRSLDPSLLRTFSSDVRVLLLYF